MNLLAMVQEKVRSQPVFDLHTHLFTPSFERLNLWGIDNILTYHYLIAEFLRYRPDVSPTSFFSWNQSTQAEAIWDELFVKSTPVSEAQTGVVTILNQLGLDTLASLAHIRQHFSTLDYEEHIDNVLQSSGVATVVMTNDPKDPSERAYWDSGAAIDPWFRTALRLDQILVSGDDEGRRDVDSIRAYLERWIERMQPAYVAISLPETWKYDPEGLISKAVLPACKERNLPFAMMIGVRRAVNPALASAGDGSGWFDITELEKTLHAHPKNRFLVTTLAKENAHGLAVLARKFASLTPFGCWWFVNNPSIIEEITDMRLELLGTSFIPQHSDARVLEHLLYKWTHSREIIARSLTKRYESLASSGYFVSEAQIESDVKKLLWSNAESICSTTMSE